MKKGILILLIISLLFLYIFPEEIQSEFPSDAPEVETPDIDYQGKAFVQSAIMNSIPAGFSCISSFVPGVFSLVFLALFVLPPADGAVDEIKSQLQNLILPDLGIKAGMVFLMLVSNWIYHEAGTSKIEKLSLSMSEKQYKKNAFNAGHIQGILYGLILFLLSFLPAIPAYLAMIIF